MIPMSQFSDPDYMETMVTHSNQIKKMGVKQGMKPIPQIKSIFESIQSGRPEYSGYDTFKVQLKIIHSYFHIDRHVIEFFEWFKPIYETGRKIDFNVWDFKRCVEYYRYLDKQVLGRWWTPLINDFLVMAFFGSCKKMIEKAVNKSKGMNGLGDVNTLHNDLLCGQDVESAQPTKILMTIAMKIDTHSNTSGSWFVRSIDMVQNTVKELVMQGITPEETGDITLATKKILESTKEQDPSITFSFIYEIISTLLGFLDRFGFRCANELKLEEMTLNDDPSFVISTVCGYVRTKTYHIEAIHSRELNIRKEAERKVKLILKGPKLVLFNWVLGATRKVTCHRENLRFARTQIFGVARSLFRALGYHLQKLNILDDKMDVFYLTIEELIAFSDGRSVSIDLKSLVNIRKSEYEIYRKSQSPPDRFLTHGAACSYMAHPQILSDMDLLKSLNDVGVSDPNTLVGLSCCPGVVEGIALVVNSLEETKNIDGHILVTARTDPGWVPVYPLCKGLLIERGSLLSHSAVIAREIGLPTIVGISGGLMNRIKTGMKLRVDATRGVITLLDE